MGISKETKAANLVSSEPCSTRKKKSPENHQHIATHQEEQPKVKRPSQFLETCRTLKNSQVELRVDLFTVERAMFSLTRSKLVQAACQVQDNKPHQWSRNTSSGALVACRVCQCGMKMNEGCVPGVIHL